MIITFNTHEHHLTILYQNEERINDSSVVSERLNQYDENSANFIVSFLYLLWRCFIVQYRDKTTLINKVGQNLVIAVFIGLVYLRRPWGELFQTYFPHKVNLYELKYSFLRTLTHGDQKCLNWDHFRKLNLLIQIIPKILILTQTFSI